MSDELYKKYSTAHLILVVEKKLATAPQSSDSYEETVRTREKALQIITNYPDKDHNNKPFPPDSRMPNRYIEVGITVDEAEQLGVKGSRISVHDLLTIVTADTGTNREEEIRKRGCAAYLLSGGPRYYDAYATAEERYKQADEAFRILSRPTPAPARTNVDVADGNNILTLLKRSPHPETMLAEQEYGDLAAGKFKSFDPSAFSIDERRHRIYTNKCIQASHENAPGNLPFTTLYDPARLSLIKTIMRTDSTASWILDFITQESAPILIHQYNVPDSELGKHGYVTFGTHIDISNRPNRAIDLQFIRIFTNISNDVDLAEYTAHEARHLWKNVKIMPQPPRSPVDRIIWEMIDECDSRAVDAKIQWGIKSRTGTIGDQNRDYIDFERDLSDRSNAGLSQPGKEKRAMQAAFIRFLETEFASPNYLKKFIDQEASSGLLQFSDANMLRRTISQSELLTPQFLRRTSQLETNDLYLDENASQRIRQIFMDKLPEAIKTYTASPRHNWRPNP